MRAAALLIAAMLAAGCGAQGKQPQGDGDGDFLDDRMELDGWEIEIEFAPYPCAGGAPPERTKQNVTSDPGSLDTDGDGVRDGDEFALGSDPRSADTDADGLSDAQERDLNLGELVKLGGGLRLNRADSDMDCLTDAEEVNGFHVEGIGERTTDPTLADTDEDGLPDGREARILLTDPRHQDTDRDGDNDLIDADPRRNLGIRLTFDRFHLKQGEGPIRLHYNMDGPSGPIRPSEPPALSISNGENRSVPAEHSPGSLDVRDTDPMHFQIWAVHEDGGAVDLGRGSESAILSGQLDPSAETWSGGGRSGPADGSVVWLSGEGGALAFRIELVTV